MPALPGEQLPPLTIKQAQKLAKQKSGQFSFTASQIRRLDRIEEAEKKRQEALERTKKSKDNKRKREERLEKERAAKRQLIEEGKLPKDAAWGKVTASQPRLSTFFQRRQVQQTKLSEIAEVEETTDQDSESDVKDNQLRGDVNSKLHKMKDTSEHRPRDEDAQLFTESELSQFFSSPTSSSLSPNRQPSSRRFSIHSPTRGYQPSAQCRSSKRSAMKTITAEKEACEPTHESDTQSRPFEVAEDETATPPFKNESFIIEDELVSWSGLSPPSSNTPMKRKFNNDHEFITPSKSIRSALSELSPSKVNIRAQEKPDPLSTCQNANNLPSPQPVTIADKNEAEDIIAMLSTQDLAEDEEVWDDKENKLPGYIESEKTQSKVHKDDNHHPLLDKLRAVGKKESHHFKEQTVDFHDEEDILAGFELDECDGEYDDGVDDAVFAALAYTQKSTNNSASGLDSYKGNTVNAKKAANEIAAPPTPHTKLFGEVGNHNTSDHKDQEQKIRLQKSSSFLFGNVDDQDMLDLAEQIDECDPKASSNCATQELPPKKRTLPWNANTIPPMSTQDLLMESFVTTSTVCTPSHSQLTDEM